MLSKIELRRAERQRLQHTAETDANKPRRVAALNEHLCSLIRRLGNAEGSVWSAFQPVGFEPDIRPVFAELNHVQWIFPRVTDQHLDFYRIDAASAFEIARYRIPEPVIDPRRRVDLAEITGLLIPGVAFDRRGGRLGRGAGHYDRTLAALQNTNSKAIKIGVAFAHQLHTETLPLEPHDILMDWVVTDEGELGMTSIERMK